MGTTLRRLHAVIISTENDEETPDIKVADSIKELYSPSGTGYDYAWVEKITQVDQLEFVEGASTEEDGYEYIGQSTFLDWDEEAGQHALIDQFNPAENHFYVKDRINEDHNAPPSNFSPDAHPIPEGWPDK